MNLFPIEIFIILFCIYAIVAPPFIKLFIDKRENKKITSTKDK